jgi:hypothetical protein
VSTEPGEVHRIRCRSIGDVNFSWAFVLEDAAPGSRLMMRARVSYTPVEPAWIIRRLITAVFAIGDVVQAGAMLRGIKARAETRVDIGFDPQHVDSASRRASPLGVSP